jgi:hypothetical protein
MSSRFHLLVALGSTLIVATLRAQTTVIGTVTDSVAHRPLAGALVQMMRDTSGETRSTRSDSLGGFRFDSVRAGSYIVGFFHPEVDDLGIELAARRVRIGGGTTHIELAIPSAKTIAAALCPSSTIRDSVGLLLGHIRDAETGMATTGTVTVLWMELVIGQAGIHTNRRQYPAKTNQSGWYALCGVPSDVDLTASAQADSAESGVVEVRVPAAGLLLRDFYVSRADSIIPVYADTAAGSSRAIATTLRRGHARVRGIVHDAKGHAVRNAEVGVPGTGVTQHTAETGAFALSGLPSGTQTVEARAFGFEPKRVPVDLAADSLTSVDIILDHPVQTLDVVKIYGNGSPGFAAFEKRARAGWGHILTPADVARRHAIRVSDLFQAMNGVRVAPSGAFGNKIFLRGGCTPTVYLNGMRLADDAADDIDAFASPGEITAVEVYNTSARPAEFWGNDCGTVVLWAGMVPR